ncbi:MAG: metalloregulator ArsR/SmtB family transcription factor [Pseudomonadota bacterium]
MSKGRTEEEAAALFAALGDGTRLGLLRRLAESEAQSIARLSHGTGLTRQAVTKHLHVLEQAGLVAGTRSGRESLYSLDPVGLGAARASLDDVSAHWDAALARLKDFVAG